MNSSKRSAGAAPFQPISTNTIQQHANRHGDGFFNAGLGSSYKKPSAGSHGKKITSETGGQFSSSSNLGGQSTQINSSAHFLNKNQSEFTQIEPKRIIGSGSFGK